MNAQQFNALFLALPPKQQSTAVYYFLGAVSFHATDPRGKVDQLDLIESANSAIKHAKESYPEESTP